MKILFQKIINKYQLENNFKLSLSIWNQLEHKQKTLINQINLFLITFLIGKLT